MTFSGEPAADRPHDGAHDPARGRADGFASIQVQRGYIPGTPQNAVAPPIYQTTAYEFASLQDAADIFALRKVGNLYSRAANPTQLIFEERVAALEGGRAAVAVASGQAAVAVALLALAKSGEHIVAARQLYGGTVDLFQETFADWGIEVTFVDQDDLDAWRDAVRPTTRALFAESVTNPTALVLDVRAVADVAHDAGVPLVIDSTVATPYLQRPGAFGADIVVHSATKYLGGHGTSMGGVIVDIGSFDFGAEPARWPQLTEPYARIKDVVLWDSFGASGQALAVLIKTKYVHDLGPSLSPFNAFQLLQGLETLDLRIARHTSSALEVAQYLADHPGVAAVHHPGVAGNPGAAAARTYLTRGAPAVFSFDLVATGDADADRDRVHRFVDGLRLVKLVANIGDARSLVAHPASMTHSHLTPQQFAEAGISPTTIRLSIGLEDPADIVADIAQALGAVAVPADAVAAAPASSPAPVEITS
ncbi:aminotransferase class I/II-fold pyridoxal phosphate-dependent enzyme [Microbacterium sp. W1N]|uniref:O-acetylhomoserine aminocarboxypropyltransferase/cysteine synthase family protein n=1 Tax=Microbacterium festucae TaxID=2977531 RepID=UPI0021BE325D|nr:aminotransferase class I/II-fold pyridoxal phosphate-dependent enzyme [Microbacterium festucae]MCT9821307.1 aminotransferase class I/II-fold pyridoxal phosphate-dependent enzyme [Microbacterium festucae]